MIEAPLTLEAGLDRLDQLIAIQILAGVASMMPDPLGFLRDARAVAGFVPPGVPDDENVKAILAAVDERLDEIFSAASAKVMQGRPAGSRT